MTMFSEDPTLPAGALLLAAACCFVALRARQEGKYLIWGLTALGLAGVVLTVEWFWVTDDERIEAVVYDLRRSLLASDAQGLLAHLTPDVQYVQAGESMPTIATRALIQASLANSKFDVVRIRELQTSAGRRTRRGKAEFKIFVRGAMQGPAGYNGAGAGDSAWSLGFEETKPGVWKVNRITPISLPFSPALLAGPAGRPPGVESSRDVDASLAPFPGPSEPSPRRGRARADRVDRKSLGRLRERSRSDVSR
ncbi:hypothetical protein [Paludisphaera mucosa]|uniref:DUF4440 domain-containing protein n=1 Tax=Paludisphaera mucosa TaxID=3030827 RepID=A0ABT6FJB7_9BACT|nr:hypothetical protein [Paludisphaera mucosa]MDG3007677.1 hypothetical protein [Paludisphaera mucosa]